MSVGIEYYRTGLTGSKFLYPKVAQEPTTNQFSLHDPLLNRKEAAKFLNVSPGTLAVWGCTKRYNLRPMKIAKAVRYRMFGLNQV